ncbi:hypothetical protein GGR42_002524 [Saonia flava]|uniref:Uncharacterized protein n=1 Tax=Saonia flava TaxID=523696 RepID=A0A846R0T3_9FLAO|nr:DUF6090 family protein [Saonia flava]NJB72033.1 hypothetical protein [Saonia flava]
MIKFFRKIRQKMLTENKFGKYLTYAVGEIILVVIGILIALSINNWNQERQLQNEEKVILKNIHTEFLENKNALKLGLEENNQGCKASITLLNLVGQNREYIQQHNLDSLMYVMLETGSFRPSENTISDLLQSGKLQLLQNDDLKNLLYKWTRNLKKTDVSFNRIELKIDNELVPYLSEHYSMKDIDLYGKLEWKNKTLLTIDKLYIFEDIQFENIMDDYLYRVKSAGDNLEELVIIIDDIIKETE